MDVIDCQFADTSDEVNPDLTGHEDVLNFVANMSAELSVMADRANLHPLSYLLSMASREAASALMDEHPITSVTPQ